MRAAPRWFDGDRISKSIVMQLRFVENLLYFLAS
ncbi:hypothetical protein ABIB81_007505 [Bradyrhizobium sp. I1.7.5]